MIFQIQRGQNSTFQWEPSELPDPTSAVSVTFYANGTQLTANLEASASRAVTGIPDRFRVSLGELGADSFAGLVGSAGAGGWFLHLSGFGQFPVRVSHFDDASDELILAEALPVGIPSAATGTIYHNSWRYVVPAGAAITQAVDRSGYYRINYQVDDDPGQTNTSVRLKSQRGRLRVVLARFDTGLSSNELQTLVPQLEATRPASREGWQPYIDRHDILGDLEAMLPADRFADQVIGEQFRRAHALGVAASLAEIGFAPNVDPERMREAYQRELEKQVSRLHWIDVDDDGLIDQGEAAVNNQSLVSLTVSSNNDTQEDYDQNRRFRPVLNNLDDR